MGFPSSPTRLDMRQTPAAYLRNLADELAGQGLDLGTSAGMSASATPIHAIHGPISALLMSCVRVDEAITAARDLRP